MTSVDTNFNFLWTSTWGLTPRPHEPDPPPCGRHKWMAPNKTSHNQTGSFHH